MLTCSDKVISRMASQCSLYVSSNNSMSSSSTPRGKSNEDAFVFGNSGRAWLGSPR